MTKWVKVATTTTKIIAKEVAKFTIEHVCCHFDTPFEITLDRG